MNTYNFSYEVAKPDEAQTVQDFIQIDGESEERAREFAVQQLEDLFPENSQLLSLVLLER